jgi:hypothetical protein
MQLSRRASWLLIAFAAWSWFIWVTLIKNISADSRSWSPTHAPTAFFGVHVVLAVISITFGSAIGWLGWRGLRASKAADVTATETTAAAPAAKTPAPVRELRAHYAAHQVELVRGETDATGASDRQTAR